MRRREFIAALGSAAAWPMVSRAQQPTKVPRLGVLLFSSPATDPNIEVVRGGLRELGYIQGQNIVIFYRYAEGKPERLADLAADLVREKPDLVLALGGDVAPYAVKATSTIPIVFVSSADPVQLGLAASLARPGGNATGVTLLLDDTASKRLELLKEAAPNVKRAAFLWNPEHPDNELREAQRAAQNLNVQLQFAEMRNTRDLDDALRTMADVGADALYVVSSRQTVLVMPRIVDFATKNHLPLAAGWGAWARAGGLLSYGPDIDEMLRRVSSYLDKVMKGAKPADLPIQQPTKFELVVNAKAAKALGLSIPPALLARADEVIE
jgi:putative ABC transport system substrate-binding protein